MHHHPTQTARRDSNPPAGSRLTGSMGKQVEDQVRAHKVAGINHQPPPLATPPPPPNAIRFQGAVVPEVEELKLLGVTFDSQLAFCSHIGQLAVRGSQRLGFLCKASAVLDLKHREIVHCFYYCFVLSISNSPHYRLQSRCFPLGCTCFFSPMYRHTGVTMIPRPLVGGVTFAPPPLPTYMPPAPLCSI